MGPPEIQGTVPLGGASLTLPSRLSRYASLVASVGSLLMRRVPPRPAPLADEVPRLRPRSRLRPMLGPLRSLAFFFLVTLAVLSLSRLFLVVRYFAHLLEVPGSWWVLPVGVGVDVTTLYPILVPAAIALLLAPVRGHRLAVAAVAAYLALTASAMALLELLTPSFLERYGARPNHLLVEHLAYPGALGPAWGIVVASLLAAGVGLLVWSSMRLRLAEDAAWSWPTRLAASVLALVVVAGGAQAHLVADTVRASAAVSPDRLAEELALNSTYTFAFAIYRRRHSPGFGLSFLPSRPGRVSP